jgi:hypothetical protein
MIETLLLRRALIQQPLRETARMCGKRGMSQTRGFLRQTCGELPFCVYLVFFGFETNRAGNPPPQRTLSLATTVCKLSPVSRKV